MRLPRPTWTLMDQSVVIATTALILAFLGIEGVIAAVVMAVPVGLLAAFTSPGKRLAVMAWAWIVVPPAMLVVLHYVEWLAICIEIGHRPGGISDPAILAVHGRFARMTLSMIRITESGILSSILCYLGMMLVRFPRLENNGVRLLKLVGPIFALPLIWALCIAIFVCSPKEIADWFID